ncbi:hypothetical protein F5I97DRAFT_1832560 [Phlebopus sp. FC_14]|nr:hypothetical protein F5I97DRAFT_1832560 [Phlebopus sp. FC_14]
MAIMMMAFSGSCSVLTVSLAGADAQRSRFDQMSPALMFLLRSLSVGWKSSREDVDFKHIRTTDIICMDGYEDSAKMVETMVKMASRLRSTDQAGARIERKSRKSN